MALLDQFGRPVKANAYNAASQGRRLKGLRSSTEGPRQLLKLNGELLRDRARQAYRNNPYAFAGIEAYVANTVGTGITPISLFPDPGKREYLLNEFKRWTDFSDFDGMTDWYGQQAKSTEVMMRDGESLIRFRYSNPQRDVVPLQLEILEADHLPLSDNSMFSGKVVKNTEIPEGHTLDSGIELDADGRRVAYHLLNDHPGEIFTSATSRIDADDLIHMFRQTRPKQLRGETHFTTVLVAIWELERYDDATRLRNILAASLTGFITTDSSDDSVIPDDGTSTDPQILEAAIEPGTFTRLGQNEAVTMADAPDVGAMYETYMRVQLRAIARGIGVTYHMLSGDPSDATYSSMRVDRIEVQRRMEQFQHAVLVYQQCRRVWNKWLNVGYLQFRAGLPGGLEIPDYPQRRAEYEAVDWQPPGWQWLDPVKDPSGSVLELTHGFTSRRRIVALKGLDVEQIDKENAEDAARAEKLGLLYGEDKQVAAQRNAEIAQQDSEAPVPKKKSAPAQEILQ